MKSQYRSTSVLGKILTSPSATLGCGWALLLSCVGSHVGLAGEAPNQSPPRNIRSSSNEAFVVFGKMTDAEGRPLAGVEVIAHCGNGTLRRTGSTVSGTEGEYRLSFGPGVMGQLLDAGALGVGFQAATISAHKSGYSIQGLGRTGNLAMTDSTNVSPSWSTNFAGVVRPFQPYRLDFRLQPASLIRGHLEGPFQQLPRKVSLCLKGEMLPPSSSVLACVDLAENGEFEFPDVPIGFPWWFEMTWREKDAWKTLRSKPVIASAPAPKTVKITVLSDALEVKQLE